MFHYSNSATVLVIALIPLTTDIGPTVQRALSDHSGQHSWSQGHSSLWMLPKHYPGQDSWGPRDPESCVITP